MGLVVIKSQIYAVGEGVVIPARISVIVVVLGGEWVEENAVDGNTERLRNRIRGDSRVGRGTRG